MEKRICDICRINESSRSYKVKHSRRGCCERTKNGVMWNSLLWTPYERIDICEECAEKLLGIRSSGIPTAREILECTRKAKIKKE